MMHGTHINTLQYDARYTQRQIKATCFCTGCLPQGVTAQSNVCLALSLSIKLSVMKCVKYSILGLYYCVL